MLRKERMLPFCLKKILKKTYEGFDPYSPEGHIILSMFQNAHLEQSIMLANSIESAFKKLSHIPSRGVKQAGFLVLRETTMPSVLIETGFLSTDVDENFLMKSENQSRVAEAIFNAFKHYKKEVEGVPCEIAEAKKTTEVKKTEEPVVTAVKTDVKTSGPKQEEVAVVKNIPVEKPDPSQTIYRIQVAASSKSTIDARYHALDDLEVVKEDALYKFVVGSYKTREEALTRLSLLKEKGFQGAFITIYKEGKRIKA